MRAPRAWHRLTAAGSTFISKETFSNGINEMKELGVDEGTITPLIVGQAIRKPNYRHLVAETIARHVYIGPPEEVAVSAAQYFTVLFGVHSLESGFSRVSTQIDVRLAFDTDKTIDAALQVIKLYSKHGISPHRLRISIIATWEGIQAAGVLEREYRVSTMIYGVFGMAQVVAASQAKVSMIAPSLEWINSWLGAKYGKPEGPEKAVEHVLNMQEYLRSSGSETKLMGADLNSLDEVLALQGVDYLRIGFYTVDELDAMPAENVPVPIKVSVPEPWKNRLTLSEAEFRWAYHQDACAVHMTAKGIRKSLRLVQWVEDLLSKKIEESRIRPASDVADETFSWAPTVDNVT